MDLIYVVEDEDNIRDLIIYALKNSGFKVMGLVNDIELEEELSKEKPSLILLDIMLEGKDGFEILRDLKANRDTKNIPVIMLTAKNEEIDKVRGLDMGADDYITKPFGVMEFISRINAVLRRSKNEDEKLEIINFKNIKIDLNKRVIKVNDENINLTFKEFELLYYLIKNKNIVLTRQKLTEEIWGFDYEGDTRTIDVHIRSLRQKIGEENDYIKTVRNVGYKIVE